MEAKPASPGKPIRIAARVSLIYSVLAGVWIFASDRLVEAYFPAIFELSSTQTYKGLAFVGITALLLYVLVRNQLRKYETEAAERQQAEVALRESESRFRQLAESLPQLVWSRTPDGECDFLSRQWVEFTGIPAEQQLGRGWLQQIHPEDRGRLVEAWQAHVTSGSSFQTEYRLRRHDGAYRWFDDRAVPLRNAEGQVVKWYGSSTDIHQQRELRESVRANEEKLRTFFEADPQCLKLLEPDGTLREINSAGLDMLEVESRAAVLGQSLIPVVLPEFRAGVLSALQATARGEKRMLEFQFAGFKGTLRWMEMSTVPFHEPGTGRVLIFSVSRDITERRRAEEALRFSQERLRACIENTPNVAVQQYGHHGRVIYWNQASERVFGWPLAEALGKTRDQLMQTPEQATRFLEQLKVVAQTGQIIGPVESEFHRRDGSAGICLSTIFAIPFDAQTSCFVSMDVDITELRRSRTEAEQSLSLLSATLEATAEGILVVDRHRRISHYNRKFAEMWCLSDSVLQTHDAKAAVVEVREQLLDPEAFVAATRAVYENPESSSQDVLHFKDGRVYERQSQPQRLGGQIVGRVWSFRDVTERRRVEQLVVQSQLRLQLVWEHALVAMRLADAEGNTVLVNPAYCRTVGKSRAELEGQPFTVAYAESDRATALADHRHRFQKHAECPQRMAEVTFWNGKRAYLEASDFFLELSDQPPLLLTIISDVTLRHQAEQRVSVLAEMARALSAASSRRVAAEIIVEAAQKLLGWDACFVHRYDPEKEQFEPVLARDTVDGQIVDVSMPVELYGTTPAVLDVLHHGPKLILRSGSAPGSEQFKPFGDLSRRSESLLFVPLREGEQTSGILSIQSYTPNAYDESSLATLQDLAEHGAGALARIRDRELLQTREQLFRSLIENTTDMITVLGRDGRMNFQSPSVERVMGYRPEEVVGRSVLDFLHPDDVPAAQAALARALTSPEKPLPFEGRLRHRDGSWRRIQSVGRLAPAATGMAGVILNARDVTESRALEEQFLQSQRLDAIGQLAGGVAHDFNNLLAVIQMQVELLKTELAHSAEQAEAIAEIGKAAQRAANLTRQLLMFSRRQPPKLTDVNLNEIVGHLTNMLQRLLGEDVQMQVNIAPQPLWIHADSVMVDQVLLNLAVNSRDAMPNGGRLMIETFLTELDSETAAKTPSARPGQFACLSVSDTGKGIALETLPHIFEPFFTTKDVGKGTGLGLATVFGIVQQHQGWITVASEPDKGATFRVFLPLVNRSRVAPNVEPVSVATERGHETILLVEDEPALRALVSIVLTRAGYRVLEAANGHSALDVWEKHRAEINLVLTDLVMPDGMSGRELAQRLLAESPELKVIYTSGYSQDIAGEDFPLREGENFLLKPFQAAQLTRTIRSRLDA